MMIVWLVIKIVIALYAISDGFLVGVGDYPINVPVFKFLFAIIEPLQCYQMSNLISAVGIATVFYLVRNRKEQKNVMLNLFSMLIAIFTVIGKSYSAAGSWEYIFGGRMQFILAFFVMVGYFLIVKNCLIFLKYIFEIKGEILRKETKGKVEAFLFEKQPFWHPCFFIFVTALPYLIFFFPGMIQADGFIQVRQYLSGELTAIHPVFDTIIMGWFVNLGNTLFHSYTAGAFLFNIAQFLLQTACFAYFLCVMRKWELPILMRWGYLLYVSVLPLFPIWGYTLAKDTGYYVFAFLFVVALADILSDAGKSVWWKTVLLVLGAVGMCIMRNNGRYVIILTLVIAAVCLRKNWKAFAIAIVSCVGISYLILGVYIPLNNIPRGLARSYLAIPLQQIARTVRDHYDDMTEDEIATLQTCYKTDIEEMGIYDTDIRVLAEYYDPENFDFIKGIFINPTDKTELAEFLKIWAMELKHFPDSYIQAFLHHSYGYFYPDRRNMDDLPGFFTLYGRTKVLSRDGIRIAFGIQDTSGRDVIRMFALAITNMPIVGSLFSVGLHSQILIGLFLYLIAKRKWKELIVLFPNVILMAGLFAASPIGGYIRYMLPIMVALPINAAWCYYVTRE